ncbi:hypothetical protein H311_03211, partial [Anncaliia algerae PRA109]
MIFIFSNVEILLSIFDMYKMSSYNLWRDTHILYNGNAFNHVYHNSNNPWHSTPFSGSTVEYHNQLPFQQDIQYLSPTAFSPVNRKYSNYPYDSIHPRSQNITNSTNFSCDNANKRLKLDNNHKHKRFNIKDLIPEIIDCDSNVNDNESEHMLRNMEVTSKEDKPKLDSESSSSRNSKNKEENIDESFVSTNHQKSTYLTNYKAKNHTEYINLLKYCKKFKYSLSNLQNLQDDNGIRLIYLVNILIKSQTFCNLKNSKISSKKFQDTYCKFIEILTEPYHDDLKHMSNYEHKKNLSREYVNFESWIELQYNLLSIEQLIKYITTLEKCPKDISLESYNKKTEILRIYIDILNTSNYKILYEILPELELINEVLNVDTQREKYKIILYLQLILCKFEVFRANFFCENPVEQEILENLYNNEEFVEVIAIISVIFGKLIKCCHINKNARFALRVYSFAHFLRAKHPEILNENGILMMFSKTKFTQNKCINFEKDEEGFIKTTFFT